RFIFGRWLAQSSQPVHLVGASIGAWRLATACLADPQKAFERFEHDYVRQQFEVPPGHKRLSPQQLSARFAQSLVDFYGGRIAEVLGHSRYRLHVVTSRGRHILGREGRARTPFGYLGAFATNSVHRKGLGAWLERCVFSTPGAALPFGTKDFRTRQHALSEENFNLVLQASCSIPFLLAAVHDIPGAPRGAYWDGGITDYHLHLDYQPADEGIVLYPHFQRAVVPGWLDKGLRWRHRSTGFLDRMVVLAPDADWVRSLPNGKLPDRKDFIHFANDAQARIGAWSKATREAERLSDEFEAWLASGRTRDILPL
ncbi:MAG TPA: patatin-like phospholipase family protein, partial [Variovorax sp.]|nr:patatin-like phospholipase family protein [Variovorax sp.]